MPIEKRSAAEIVFVDDDPAVLTSLCRLVSDLPLSARLCHSAEAALELIELQAPDIVVSDYHLGGMDGVALLTQVRKAYPHVLTFLHTSETRLVLRRGDEDFVILQKPCEVHVLRRMFVELAASVQRRCEPSR